MLFDLDEAQIMMKVVGHSHILSSAVILLHKPNFLVSIFFDPAIRFHTR